MADDCDGETQLVPIEVLGAISRFANGEQTATKDDLARVLKLDSTNGE
jgi:hypothetical protein